MLERHKEGLCYYCDENYSPGHKCREQKLFQIDASYSYSYIDIPSNGTPDPKDSPPSVHVEDSVAFPVEPEETIISLHAL
jgi:hypothetical protein